ncbi:MAG: PAS domain S-box protein, partial [Spirochaetia bacterium]|nr:PAS domain S-box protein [Spirochaetia bacterium]
MNTADRNNAAVKSSGETASNPFAENSDTASNNELLQIFYEISLAIGDSLVQRTMLSKSLSTYLKKLECSMGAVIQAKTEGGTLNFDIAYSIPRNFERQASDYEEIIRKQGPEVAKEGLDVIKGKQADNYYYIMSLSDIGLLFLLKPHAPLEDHIIDALRPLNTKLGKAFRACLQSEAYIQNNQQFMQMTNMLPGILFEIDTSKRITFINKRTYEIFKTIDSDQFKPKTIYELFKKDEIPKLDDLFSKIEEGTALVSADSWMQTMRGTLLPVSLNLSPINRDQQIVGFRGIATDISERIKYENKQKQLLKKLSENIREMNCLYGISRLTSDSDLSLDEIFNEGVNIIPGSFEKEDLISAEIKFQEQRYESRDFHSTDNWIYSDIFINGEKAGNVSVFAPEEYAFQKHEKELLEALGHQFGNIASKMTIEEERTRLYNNLMEDLDTAQSVQNFLLPAWFINDDDILFSSDYSPSSKIGGDLFDMIRLDNDSYVMYIGDISGHGVQAALTMTAVKSIINMTLEQDDIYKHPEKVISTLNSFLSKELFDENYMT